METNNLLKQLVAVHSPYPQEMEMQAFITALFLKRGFQVRVQEVEGDRGNVIVEKGTGDRTILLYSHLDTVPVADGWTRDPFTPQVEGDRLYGLGAFDMKGGIAVNIETFLNFNPKHFKLRLLFCVDEEYISKGGHVFAASPLMKDVGCILSPEPAFDHGVNGIVTGRIGRAVITISLQRASEHFYYYRPEHDISLAAATIVTALKTIYRDEAGKKEFAFVRSMHAQSSGMSTPQSVTMELDVSIVAPRTPQTMLTHVRNIVANAIGQHTAITSQVEFKKRTTPFLAGYELDPQDRYLAVMKQAVKSVTGKKAIPYFRSSVADENIFGSAGKSVLGIGPAGGNAHAADEWVSLSSLANLGEIYKTFLRTVDSSV